MRLRARVPPDELRVLKDLMPVRDATHEAESEPVRHDRKGQRMGHQPAMGREGVNGVEELLARIALWSRTFVLRTGPGVVDAAEREAAADPADAVYRGDVLADPGSGAATEAIALHARGRGMDPDLAAASLAFQRYAHRVAGVAVAAWAAEGLILDLTAPRVWTVVRLGQPASPRRRAGARAP